MFLTGAPALPPEAAPEPEDRSIGDSKPRLDEKHEKPKHVLSKHSNSQWKVP